MEDLVCNECKGRKFRKISNTEYECEYCGAIIKEILKTESPQIVIVQQPIENKPEPIVSPFPAEVSYAGSRSYSITSFSEGRFIINPDKFIFEPNTSNIFNTGNLSPQEWRITDIAGYTNGAMARFTIRMKNGEDIAFASPNKKQIIKLLEERRKYWAEQSAGEGVTTEDINAKRSGCNVFLWVIIAVFSLICIFGWISLLS